MLDNLAITKKIVAAFFVVVGVFIISSLVANASMSSLAATQKSNVISNTVTAQADQMLTAMIEQEDAVRGYALSGNTDSLARYAQSRETLTKLALEFRAITELPIQKTRIDALLAAMSKVNETAFRQIIGLAADPSTRGAAQALAVRAHIEPARAILQAISDLEKPTVAGQRERLADAQAATVRSLWIGSALAIAIAALAGWLLSRIIAVPIVAITGTMTAMAAGDYASDVAGADRGDELGAMAKAVRVFRRNGIAKQGADEAKAVADAEQKRVVDTVAIHLSDLSGGDLTATITSDFPADYATLKTNFNEALDKLRELIGSVSESAATIRTGSGEIAQASEDLARRTESNAASLEETAASVTQMDGRIKASTQAASRTVERADQAIATVGGGRAVADQAVQAMGRVSESAKGIDSVIEGLDKIAFQTRVLAMNAAVEAGRAGDAGRGFAVVADLVSALAMRAEEEAKRARDQLTVTQTDIVTAVDAVTKVDSALSDISGDVGQVHELLATMAADNQAQSAAITQISAAIGTMDRATQQNAAMVEETSAAARNLAAEVGGLTEQAGRFNVGRGGVASNRTSSASSKTRYVDPQAYASPVKPLPAGIAALVRADNRCDAF
ncbi:MAG TPA: methyl-accepting chemotaxis protein [Sphingomonas sp.]|nr:methyl-accepting chemotaxis protein [Sphingomonas sp.]